MKKSLKELVVMTVCSLMVGTALTGCGTKTSTSGSSTSTSAKVTLTFSLYFQNNLKKAWEKRNVIKLTIL